MKRRHITRENDKHIEAELRCIPLELVEKISEDVYDFLVFIAIGSSCRTLLPLLKCDSDHTPIRRFLIRNHQKFRETVNFYYKLQSRRATTYVTINMMFNHIIEVILPFNRINYRDNLDDVLNNCNDRLKIMNMDGKPLTLKMLFDCVGGITITKADKWVAYILNRLEQLLKNRHMRLFIEDDKYMHWSPFISTFTLDMVILIGDSGYIL